MREDGAWLSVMMAITAFEFVCWAGAWRLGFAPSPYIFTYLALAFAGLVCVLSLRGVTGTLAATPNWWSMVPATILIGIGASLFLPLKYAIPQIVPFWLDRPLVDAERLIFAGDPWLRLDHLLGWAAVPIDRVYGLWLPTQSIASVQSGNAAFLDNEIARPDRLCSRVVPAWRRRRDGAFVGWAYIP